MSQLNEKFGIGARLKEFSRKNFGGVAGLERSLGKKPGFLTNYLNGRSYLGGEILSELSKRGCDINWLLNGEPSPGMVKEKQPDYGADEFKSALNSLTERLDKLEKQNEGLVGITAAALIEMKNLNKEISELRNVDEQKNEVIERLSLEFTTLLAANHIKKLTESGDTNIK